MRRKILDTFYGRESEAHIPYFLPVSPFLLDVVALVGKIGAKQNSY